MHPYIMLKIAEPKMETCSNETACIRYDPCCCYYCTVVFRLRNNDQFWEMRALLN